MADWSEPFTAEYRHMRVSRATGREVGLLAQFDQSGTLSYNVDKQTKASGSCSVHAPLDIGADLVRVYLDATGQVTGWQESVCLGTYLPSVASYEIDGVVRKAPVALDGRLKELADDDFDVPLSVPAGSDPVAYAAEIVRDCGLSVAGEVESGYELSVPWSFGLDSGERGKLTAVNALLALAGFSSADTDAMGNVVFSRYVELADRAPVHTFEEGPGARFLARAADERDSSQVANVVRAVYSTQESTVIGSAVDSDPASEWSTATVGRRIAKTYDYNDEATQEQADAKAAELLRTEQSVIRRVTVRHVIVPGLVSGDAVAILWPTGGVSGKFSVRTQDIDLGAGCMVTSELKRTER